MNSGFSESSYSAQNKKEQGSMPIYSEPIYSYPTSPPMRGTHSSLALASPAASHKCITDKNTAANIPSWGAQESLKMSIYGTLPRARIHRRQPLQRVDSENSETDDASISLAKTLPLTKATTFFKNNEDQDYYGENNIDVNQNIQSSEHPEQIINARNLRNYATFRHLHGVPHHPYFQHQPSLLCGPMIPLHLASPIHPPPINQQQLTPMAQWSRDDLHLILSPENGGGPLSGSSGRNKVLDSKNHFKNQIRKLEHRQQKISRSFEQLVELTEPDDDEEEGNIMSSLSVIVVPDTRSKMNSSNIDDGQHDILCREGEVKHEAKDANLLNNSSSRSVSPDRDSSANDIRYIAVTK